MILLGMWFQNGEATPLLNLDPSVTTSISAEHRLEQIEQLRTTEWTISQHDQETLWTWYWQSRLGIQYDDPDVFERILNIQIQLAAKHPEEALHHLEQSNVLPEWLGDTQRDYDLDVVLLPEETHRRIHAQLAENQAIWVPYLRNDLMLEIRWWLCRDGLFRSHNGYTEN